MKIFGLFCILVLAFEQALGMAGFTPLEIDNHPCTAQNLKRTNRYICDTSGNVICQSGWKNPEGEDMDPLNPCSEPICDHDGQGCLHGECRAPNYCACEVGWEGVICDICVPLPGCENGNCSGALECNCFDDWSGAYCDIPDCNNCGNGQCFTPNDCICFNGWQGDNCTDCIKLPGCDHGHCGDHPNTCECEDGWEGHLCDVPVCTPHCIHGECFVSANSTLPNFCVCETGWSGAACDQCVPYWECPNTDPATACNLPNECLCGDDIVDPEGLCSHEALVAPTTPSTT